MVVLNPPQLVAKDVVAWLMSDDWSHIATGRSHLMALIFIDKAIQKPGVWIGVWDHGPYHPKKEENMLRLISSIVSQEYDEWNFKISHTKKAFSMEKR